jgi:hypothetical protein
MKGLQANQPSSHAASHHSRTMLLIVFSICIAFAFIVSAWGAHALASANTTVHSSSSPATVSYPIKVFFSRYPESVSTDVTAVYAVDRVSPTSAVGTFALQLLIAGPTLSEQQAGYFTELNTMLSGPSNCSGKLPVGGPDFKLTLNMKGSVPEKGTATVQFCRTLTSTGIGADGRVTAEINATLKQFPTIQKVVILTKDGHCFGDLSGKDFCLK